MLAADGIVVADLGLRGPSLDEAFLALTGQRPPGGIVTSRVTSPDHPVLSPVTTRCSAR